LQSGIAGEQTKVEQQAEVEDVVADGDAAACVAVGRDEGAEGEVLDGEVGVTVGVFDPRGELGIVRLIEGRRHRVYFTLGSKRLRRRWP
jgi:hypothetical protein